ncbi:hypothetical protein Poli38472_005659 [Pythium oligandrum]|uniref:Uncharacterized protein n=1 Tax=Pythium oligandrum TaxID=41045 RepID=A0A8K1CHT6_PYTOL|nr:hypothetical protein Poli38472_005659 [Pythium oligandrum]|eukprot:TMW63041.1 hypothetical protein Poli38472_005659 [Pythium oligandrum]
MLATSVRRVSKTTLATLQNQRRHGGSLHKNKHVENYNNWRGDSEKRFKFDKEFFQSLFIWGILPSTVYYVVASSERRQRDQRFGLPDNFRE